MNWHDVIWTLSWKLPAGSTVGIKTVPNAEEGGHTTINVVILVPYQYRNCWYKNQYIESDLAAIVLKQTKELPLTVTVKDIEVYYT